MLNSNLASVRKLLPPSREETFYRLEKVDSFWRDNRSDLIDAWNEWEKSEGELLIKPDESLISDDLRESICKAWENPSTEKDVKKHWKEILPGVFTCQVFDPSRLHILRDYMDKAMSSGIPIKQPYGIVLNRNGAMLDKRTDGYLAAPAFETFYRQLFDKYVRPIARLLFPEVTGNDTQTFGFSMQYEPHNDTSIRSHTDASAVTFNVNLNRPDEAFLGSNVDFYDPLTKGTKSIRFAPGVAVIHRGSIPHAAHPITEGKRTNWVLWLYGDRGYVLRGTESRNDIPPSERWAIPDNMLDKSAPF